MTGRLHTCYSPVRRSPAEVSKLTPPLPLDLHVLSLSLAFILSQDQTLRCWLSCFFLFFSNQKKARQACFIVYCLHKTTVCCFRVQSVPAPSDQPLYCAWSKIDRADTLSCIRSLVLLRLYCNNFNVLCSVSPSSLRGEIARQNYCLFSSPANYVYRFNKI